MALLSEQARNAFIRDHYYPVDIWIYGSPCRPLHSSWFRVEGAMLVQVSVQETGHYTYVVMPQRMSRDEMDANELSLVSRPAR